MPTNSDDVDNKCVIVLDEALPLGLLTNTAAVLGVTLGDRLQILGPDLRDGDNQIHTGLTTIPIPILKAPSDVVASIRQSASQFQDVFVADVSDAAQTTVNYADYERKLTAASAAELCYLGVALYGAARVIRKMTGSLSLLR